MNSKTSHEIKLESTEQIFLQKCLAKKNININLFYFSQYFILSVSREYDIHMRSTFA